MHASPLGQSRLNPRAKPVPLSDRATARRIAGGLKPLMPVDPSARRDRASGAPVPPSPGECLQGSLVVAARTQDGQDVLAKFSGVQL